jgi:hypothetical protein
MNSRPCRVLVCVGWALVVAAVVIAAGCSKRPGLEKRVTDMIAAHNRHDLTGQMAFFADDATYAIAEQTPVVGKAPVREIFGADSVMKSELVYEGLTVHRDTVIVSSVTERNDLLRLLGLEEVHYLPGTRLVFQKGLIHRLETTRLEQKEWRTMRDNFAALMTWLQAAHPELMSEVGGTGRLSRNNAESAAEWLKLAAEWRKSQSREEK